MSGQGSGGNVLAALCNIFFPGLGQLLQGRLFKAILFFFCTSISYGLGMGLPLIFFFMLPIGAIFHLWAIIDAAKYRSERYD